MSEALPSSSTLSTEPSDRLRIGVLSFHNSKETKAILNSVRALGHQPVWLREDNVRTWVADGHLDFAPDVDVVVNRLLTTKASQPIDDLGIASSFAVARPVLNPTESVMRAMHKYRAAAELSAAGIRVPDAYMALSHETINDADVPLEGKRVHKPAIGTNGRGMRRVESDDSVAPNQARRRTFLQEFLELETGRVFDVRVYVVDGEVVGAMKRFASGEEWRTNVALGGAVEGMSNDLPSEAATLAVDATAVLDLDYAGVDLLRCDGTWYVLEVNATAGFKGLFDATGTSPAPFIAKLAIERGAGFVDDDRVSELAETLDDSVPHCKPSADPSPDGLSTIGYTERIAVGGSRGIEEVVAKSDTGAKRTSIDFDIAADIGVGPLVGTTRVKSGGRTGNRKRPLVDLDLRVGDRWYSTRASLEDRGHMQYSVIIGRDVLRGCHVDVTRRVSEE